jgi:legumain
LCSGPNDHVFVNFVDHGAPGLLAFPTDELYADDLEKALRKMAVNRQFARVRLNYYC